MMRLSLALAMLAGSVVSSYAQDPYAVAPHAYKKQFENELVRVTRVHYAPHEQLTEHGHPARPTIYIYLTDGGPVLFKHEHGDSGAMAATRPATKAGAYRIALGRNETHVVDNQSDLPSDFLQVELKTDIDPKTFNGRRFRDPADAGTSSSKVEFDTSQVRITRVTCDGATGCKDAIPVAPNSALQITIATGDTTWLRPGTVSGPPSAGEYLLLEFKQGSRAERP